MVLTSTCPMNTQSILGFQKTYVALSEIYNKWLLLFFGVVLILNNNPKLGKNKRNIPFFTGQAFKLNDFYSLPKKQHLSN